MEARKGPRGLEKASERTPRTRPWPKTAPERPLEPLRDPRRAASGPPGRPKRAPRAPRGGPKTVPKEPKTGSTRQSRESKERLSTKKRKVASRLGGSTIFEGRTAQKMAPNRPDLAAESAQKASPTEDSTRTVEQSAGTPEIRPRTADGRLQERSQIKNQVRPEAKIHPSGQSCVRSALSIYCSTVGLDGAKLL